MPRWIYDFGEADPSKIESLGGKGANLAAMTALGLPVPPGFTITTDAWRSFKGAGTQPVGLSEEIERHLGRLEGVMGRSFGDAQDPLLVSVRSGSPRSMPGMMDTILNVGLTDDTVEGLAAQTGDPSFAWDCYRRLVRMFSETVMQVQRSILDEVAEMKRGLDGSELHHAKRRFDEHSGSSPRLWVGHFLKIRASSCDSQSRQSFAPGATNEHATTGV